MELDKIIQNLRLMSAEEVNKYRTALNYMEAIDNTKQKILSMLVPDGIGDENPRPYTIKLCVSAEDEGTVIPYVASNKLGWRDILMQIGRYMNIDFSDVLDKDGDFLHIWGANGEECNPKLSPEERANAPKGVRVGAVDANGDIIEDESEVSNVDSEVSSEVSEVETVEAEVVEE